MPQTDPTAYLTAVAAALQADEIAVLNQEIDSQPPRCGRIRLDCDTDEIAGTDLESVTVDWSEDTGWSVTVRYQADIDIVPDPIERGLDLVPTPEVVAAWVGLVLTSPEAMPSRPAAALPATTTGSDLDTALQRYATHHD
ncbi:hypothetical protein FHX42_005193 [Saccharopolyspora lacisalsi]|uniref:DUF6292 domain-containing protein n=1 Tax=Halosaccharopolyspora lacisalsi TaxID=1000566 RepID=A0A839E588_9PSEU|nr:DUF6292 family protein [Halosaccharopolyspora lacisalsi]MBA8827786.1 hypothetical protein [Halosaccharopolyspora lacisalsi]